MVQNRRGGFGSPGAPLSLDEFARLFGSGDVFEQIRRGRGADGSTNDEELLGLVEDVLDESDEQWDLGPRTRLLIGDPLQLYRDHIELQQAVLHHQLIQLARAQEADELQEELEETEEHFEQEREALRGALTVEREERLGVDRAHAQTHSRLRRTASNNEILLFALQQLAESAALARKKKRQISPRVVARTANRALRVVRKSEKEMEE